MGECQPCGELRGRLIRSGPVKRHHGGRHARGAQQLCAPAVADGYDFYEVRPPADGFFETMNGHGDILTEGERRRFYASAGAGQAKRDAKTVSTPSRAATRR